MPGFPFPGRPGPEADDLLGMILDGRSLPPDAPEDLHALAVTLADLAGPAGPGELAGEAAVRSALARRASPVGVSPARPARRKPPRRAPPPQCGGRRRAGRGSDRAGRHRRCRLRRRAARPDPEPRPPGDPRSASAPGRPSQTASWQRPARPPQDRRAHGSPQPAARHAEAVAQAREAPQTRRVTQAREAAQTRRVTQAHKPPRPGAPPEPQLTAKPMKPKHNRHKHGTRQRMIATPPWRLSTGPGAWRPRAELAYLRSHGAEPAGRGRSRARAGFGEREGGRYLAAGAPANQGR